MVIRVRASDVICSPPVPMFSFSKGVCTHLGPSPVFLEGDCSPPAQHGCHALRYLIGATAPLVCHRLRPLRVQQLAPVLEAQNILTYAFVALFHSMSVLLNLSERAARQTAHALPQSKATHAMPFLV